MTALSYFPSWEQIPPRARFTVRPASIGPNDDITPGRVYEACKVGSRQAWFYDDAGRERMLHGSCLVPSE